jgi:hypothetical protein
MINLNVSQKITHSRNNKGYLNKSGHDSTLEQRGSQRSSSKFTNPYIYHKNMASRVQKNYEDLNVNRSSLNPDQSNKKRYRDSSEQAALINRNFRGSSSGLPAVVQNLRIHRRVSDGGASLH